MLYIAGTAAGGSGGAAGSIDIIWLCVTIGNRYIYVHTTYIHIPNAKLLLVRWIERWEGGG